MAQAVPSQQPILDDEEDDGIVNSAINAIKPGLDSLSQAVEEAIYGKPTSDRVYQSATSVASDLYQSAYTAASRAVYGEEATGTAKVASIASEKYDAAVKA